MKSLYDILIVEDEPVVINSARRILANEGMKIDSCQDARTALNRLSEYHYRMVISDVMLPGMSGLQFLQELGKKYPDLNVVMITGHATLDCFLDSFNSGAFDFIPKPFEFEELLGAVLRCIRYTEYSAVGDEKSALPAEIAAGDVDEVRFCLGNHTWFVTRSGEAIIGLGKSFSVLGGDIRRIEFPDDKPLFNQGDVILRIVDGHDYIHRVCTPVSGRYIGRNSQLNLESLNSDEITRNWLVRLKPSNLEVEVKTLKTG